MQHNFSEPISNEMGSLKWVRSKQGLTPGSAWRFFILSSTIGLTAWSLPVPAPDRRISTAGLVRVLILLSHLLGVVHNGVCVWVCVYWAPCHMFSIPICNWYALGAIWGDLGHCLVIRLFHDCVAHTRHPMRWVSHQLWAYIQCIFQ